MHVSDDIDQEKDVDTDDETDNTGYVGGYVDPTILTSKLTEKKKVARRRSVQKKESFGDEISSMHIQYEANLPIRKHAIADDKKDLDAVIEMLVDAEEELEVEDKIMAILEIPSGSTAEMIN